MKTFDFVIVGGGVVGLAVAREILIQKKGSVAILEKEANLGVHTSGRNSGVIHAGLYYPPGTLKAQLCVRGHKLMLEYCEQKNIRHSRVGKVIVAPTEALVSQLDLLLDRSKQNGVEIRAITLEELREIEPEAVSCDHALHSPNTAIMDTKAVLKSIQADIESLGGQILFDHAVKSVDGDSKTVKTTQGDVGYGCLVNSAGLHADKIAHSMGVGADFRILPFKGIYWATGEAYQAKIRGLIYPTPDLNMPFLGVHVTKSVDGRVLLGPTAIPAFGRENYGAIEGLNLLETPVIATSLMTLMIKNPSHFREYVSEEFGRYFPANFVRETQKLTPSLTRKDITQVAKVGIRAQLYNRREGKLVMDFLVKKGKDSIHVLNAVSPAFTCSLSFAEYLVNQVL